MSDALLEEFEVLEAIYPTELQRISERDVEIEAEADDIPDGADNVQVTLCVHYTDTYPDELPELSLKHEDPKIDDNDVDKLLADLKKVGEDNLGMAMTFTLVSQLREQLSELVRFKIEEENKREREKERLLLEEEEKRTRGTPVTIESFKAWKAAFDKEIALKKAQEEEERLKNLTPKEREEWKRASTRLSGRQLFERNKIVEDETLVEEGAVSVDVSQYERTKDEDEEQDEALTFSDSD
ncbi:RWD domain-containing protein 1 [Psilocybe cubensis]|uniref:RWD domain-containing protein 1 n=2 Tax=Psilocybe cubensis TaxID=181762 RepID=A0ACB8H919_PSICU|nr:RWD domain-containing protein 1 [Psilocybe cubensis]KAH9484314.1 RWD domain-containing protein 1 [Psilocybe cubensis]